MSGGVEGVEPTLEQMQDWLVANCGKGLPYGEAKDRAGMLHGLAYVLRQIEGTNSYKVNIGQCNSATSAIRMALEHFAREALTAPPARTYAEGVPLEVAEALLPYTSHAIGCAIYQQSWHVGAPECTCGVEEARAAIRILSRGEKA